MAHRKMTFTLPEDVAGKFLRRVPAQERSRYVTEAISAKLRERDDRMIRACEVANKIAAVGKIEKAWDALADNADVIEEPWT